MTEWKAKIVFSVFLGGAAFLAVLLPAVIAQYRRFGRPSLLRLIGTAVGCVYGVALVAFTLFPLPTVAEACGMRTGPVSQWIPFHFLADLAEKAHKTSWPTALTSVVVIQVVMNVALFVPLGALLRSLGGCRLVTSIVAGFLVSLAIEATQYTGNWGLYPCGFRVADVDDLLANTGGAVIGALVAPRLLGWMPSGRALRALEPGPVSLPRRWLGMALDWATFTGVVVVLQVVANAVPLIVAQLLHVRIDPPDLWGQIGAWSAVIATLAVVLLPALLGTGASPGQRMVGITPVWGDEDGATVPRRLRRTLPVAGVYALAQILLGLLYATDHPLLFLLVGLAASGWMVVAIVGAARGDHRGLSARWSGARMVDVRGLRRPVGGAAEARREAAPVAG